MKSLKLLVGVLFLNAAAATAAMAAPAKLSCESTGTDAGLEDLTLVSRDGGSAYEMSVTVSGPGDFIENDSYRMTRAGSRYESAKAGLASLELGAFKNGEAHGKLVATGPARAQLWSGSRFEYSVTCRASR